MPKETINAYFKGTLEYTQDFEKRANLSSEKRDTYSLMATSHKLCSQLQAVRVAPDGFVYVFSTSGVYRFQSTKEGLVYLGPSITWLDTLATIRDLSIDEKIKQAIEPVMGGMTFTQRRSSSAQ